MNRRNASSCALCFSVRLASPRRSDVVLGSYRATHQARPSSLGTPETSLANQGRNMLTPRDLYRFRGAMTDNPASSGEASRKIERNHQNRENQSIRGDGTSEEPSEPSPHHDTTVNCRTILARVPFSRNELVLEAWGGLLESEPWVELPCWAVFRRRWLLSPPRLACGLRQA